MQEKKKSGNKQEKLSKRLDGRKIGVDSKWIGDKRRDKVRSRQSGFVGAARYC